MIDKLAEGAALTFATAVWPISAAGAVAGWAFNYALTKVEDLALDALDVWDGRIELAWKAGKEVNNV